MATVANTLANVMDKILARGLLALREQVILPRLVNRNYETEAREYGDTIDVPTSTAVAVQAVTPAEADPAPAATTPGKVQIALDQWYETVPFHLSDKDLKEIDANRHYLPLQTGEALKSLANKVNQSIWETYVDAYGYVGTAGTTPFGSNSDIAVDARKVLNHQLCPKDNRIGILDLTAEAKALKLAEFKDADKAGDQGVKVEGEIGRKFGMQWFTDDHVPLHTAGTAGADTDTIAVDNGAGYAAGIKSMNIDVDTGTSTFVAGDIFSISHGGTIGDRTYVCTNAGTIDTTGVTVTFEPGLAAAVADDVELDFKDDHTVNLAMRRDAIAFVSRPLASGMDNEGLGSMIRTMGDPVSGLNFRMEVKRQWRQTVFTFDALWGRKMVRPEFACRIAG